MKPQEGFESGSGHNEDFHKNIMPLTGKTPLVYQRELGSQYL